MLFGLKGLRMRPGGLVQTLREKQKTLNRAAVEESGNPWQLLSGEWWTNMSRPTTLSRPITERSSAGFMGDPALTQAPGPNRAVPFLPGMAYGNPARRRFPKSHIFEFKVGVGRSLAVMGTEVRR